MRYLILSFCFLAFFSCGTPEVTKRYIPDPSKDIPLSPIDAVGSEVIHGRAVFTITMDNSFSIGKFFTVIPMAMAATSSKTVTYTNAISTVFTVDTSSFVSGNITNDILSLGTTTVTALKDNNLSVCGAGTTKCNTAKIRIYTIGATQGFVQQDENYGVPLYAGTLNPNSALGLNTAGAVDLQTYIIPGNMHRLTLAAFPTPTYSVTSDFTNAGAGNYSANFVLEYVLQ